MEQKWLVELTKSTVDEIDRLLTMQNSEYIKEFGVEADRVDKAKLEKVQTLNGTLRFFINKATATDCMRNE